MDFEERCGSVPSKGPLPVPGRPDPFNEDMIRWPTKLPVPMQMMFILFAKPQIRLAKLVIENFGRG